MNVEKDLGTVTFFFVDMLVTQPKTVDMIYCITDIKARKDIYYISANVL